MKPVRTLTIAGALMIASLCLADPATTAAPPAAPATDEASVRILRKYVEGNRDRLKITANMQYEARDIDVEMVISQTVEKVHPDGAADVRLVYEAVEILAKDADGKIVRQEIPKQSPSTIRMDVQGRRVGQLSGGHGAQIDPLFFLTIVPPSILKVGQSHEFDVRDMTRGGAPFKGTLKLVEITDGKAKFEGEFEITPAGAKEPEKVVTTSEFDVATGRFLRGTGKLTNVAPTGSRTIPSVKGMEFSIELLPAKEEE